MELPGGKCIEVEQWHTDYREGTGYLHFLLDLLLFSMPYDQARIVELWSILQMGPMNCGPMKCCNLGTYSLSKAWVAWRMSPYTYVSVGPMPGLKVLTLAYFGVRQNKGWNLDLVTKPQKVIQSSWCWAFCKQSIHQFRDPLVEIPKARSFKPVRSAFKINVQYWPKGIVHQMQFWLNIEGTCLFQWHPQRVHFSFLFFFFK